MLTCHIVYTKHSKGVRLGSTSSVRPPPQNYLLKKTLRIKMYIETSCQKIKANIQKCCFLYILRVIHQFRNFAWRYCREYVALAVVVLKQLKVIATLMLQHPTVASVQSIRTCQRSACMNNNLFSEAKVDLCVTLVGRRGKQGIFGRLFIRQFHTIITGSCRSYGTKCTSVWGYVQVKKVGSVV